MATVVSPTVGPDNISGPGVPAIIRGATNGSTLYTLVRTAASTLSVYRSTNGGTSWASLASFAHTSIAEWCGVYEPAGYLHIGYRVSNATDDRLYYRRLNLSNFTFSTALQVSGTALNGGTPGARFQAVEMAVVRNSNTTYAIALAGAYADLPGTGAQHGVYIHGVSIKASAGTIYLNNGIITGTRAWFSAGTPGRSGLAMELEHNGDGQTSSVPNLWVTWGRSEVRMVRVAWVNSTVGWQGPTTATVIRSTLPTAQDHCAGRWDGTQWMMAVPSPDDSSIVRVYQRNKANTTTTTYDSPQHPQGTVKNCAISYDNTTKDIRIYAVGTTTAVLYFVDYDRSLSTWGVWTVVTATAISNSVEWSVRRGGTYGNARFDVITEAGSVTPWVVTHTAQTVSTPPSVATFTTTTQPYANGAAASITSALSLTWTFSDVDPGQTQGTYALSRQIGAGAIAYWNATTSVWGVSEVQNSSSTPAATIPTAWGIDGDPAHTYKVKVWDSAGTPSAGYSAALVLIPSTPVNPAIVLPTAAQVVTANSLNVSWTSAEQVGARIRLSQNPGGTVVYDSGPMIGYVDTDFDIPYLLPNNTGWTVTVNTYNNEKLISADQTRNFTVSYAPPPPVISTFTPVSASGWITVTPTSLTPAGTQPTINAQDLHRRVRTAISALSNSTFTTNVTGWTGAGGTLTYSTTQSHSSPGAGRMVPNASADALVTTTTQTDISAAVAVGGNVHVTGWLRPDTANKSVKITVNFLNSGGTQIDQQFTTISNISVGAWQFFEFIGDLSTVVAGVVKATVSIGLTGTPASGDAFYVDDVELRVANDDDTGVRIVAGGTPGVAYNDWGVAALVDYEYRWVTLGSNGTNGYGPWQG